ncbi:hypothetical protein MRB53_015064 [Persea americana]|uniref:Uncharacterized protein n=1 Tax=Persea americana TaxID=3435 RepID=A0ACC2KCM4_PERAE|nr:hypothetical protein MRB53_015064 [Persea americana]
MTAAMNRQIEDAQRMFDRMPERDLVTWNAIISRAIHGYTVRVGFELLVNVTTTLVDMYMKCGLIRIARLVFDRMQVKNVVSWNSMIDGYAQYGYTSEAMTLF